MDIGPADASASQRMTLDEDQRFIVARDLRHRQCLQLREEVRTSSQMTAGQFTDDEGMA